MSSISSDVDAFVSFQNKNRGLSGEQVALDYNALTGTVPTGGNSVTGIAGISAGAATIALGAGYNAVILDGSHSVQAAAAGQPDNYAISTDASGAVTILDENTGQTELVTGASYLVFNGGAVNSSGNYQSVYLVESGVNAEIAALYNAALGRVPDLPGLEYYAVRLASGAQTIQDQAANFIASPEFQSRFAAASLPADNGGADDKAFVDALYQNVLHRSASAFEVNFYVAALQNGEAGSIVNTANPVEWTRAQELINFATSPENLTDISGWLINTTNGAYSDPGYGLPGSESASSVLTVSSGGTIDTGDINLGTVTGGGTVIGGGWSSPTGVALLTSGWLAPAGDSNKGGAYLMLGESDLTIYLSAQVPNIDVATSSTVSGETIYGPTSGSAEINYALNSDVIHLSGTGNKLFNQDPVTYYTPGQNASLTHAAPNPLVVYGLATGDTIEFYRAYGSGGGAYSVDIIQTPAAGTTIQGASFINPVLGTANTAPTGQWFNNTTIAINVGSVSDNTAATMATAAAKVYTPSHATDQYGNAITGLYGDESIIFFGQGANNDTVVYKWFADATHQVSATTMVGGLDLIGVTPAQFSALLHF